MRVVERELELRLVSRLKAGDAAAFDAVYEAYRARLFSFLVRLSRHGDVAEDLLEETWLRLVTSASHLADDTSLAAWLFTVARNLHASWARHRALEDTRIFDGVLAWPAPAPGETPFEAAARSEVERRLERALVRLRVPDREILLLVVVEQLPPSTVAAALGLTPEALRKRLQRARERLAAAMATEGGLAREKAG